MQVKKGIIIEGPLSSLCHEYIDFRRSLGYHMDDRCLYDMKYLADALNPFLSSDKIIIDRDMVLAFTRKRDNESERTQKRRIYLIRCFCRFLSDKGICAYILPYENNRCDRSFTPFIFTHEQIRAFFKACDDYYENSCPPVFYPLIFRILYGCGLRSGEVCRLRIEDVDLSLNCFTVRSSKYNTTRLVPFHSSITPILISYLSSKKFSDSDFLFSSSSNSQLSHELIYQHFRRYLKYAGIPHGGRGKGPRVHDLRHTFAVHTLDAIAGNPSVDLHCFIPYLFRYMGHRCLESTEKYLRLVPETYRKVMDLVSGVDDAIFPEVEPYEE